MNANNIKALREKQGLKVADIARALDISHVSVLQWERGDTMPRAALMPQLANILNCKIDDFFCNDSSFKIQKEKGA